MPQSSNKGAPPPSGPSQARQYPHKSPAEQQDLISIKEVSRADIVEAPPGVVGSNNRPDQCLTCQIYVA